MSFNRANKPGCRGLCGIGMPGSLASCLALMFLWAELVIAAPDISIPSDRPSDQKLLLEPPVKKKKPPIIDLPPFERKQNENPSIKDLLNFVARKFRFEGNTVFSDQQLATLIDKFRLTPINALDLEELRLLITNHYIKQGYINSGALFPDQNLLGGLLIIEITEGVLQNIQIENAGRLSIDYIKDRLRFPPKEPLKLDKLQAKLNLLQQDPRIERLKATLLPGETLGTSVLEVKITEAKPYAVNLEFNNHRPPSIDEAQTVLSLKHINISGGGDSIEVGMNHTSGSRRGSIQYNYPISTFESKTYVGASHYDMGITDPVFGDFTVRGYSVHTGIKSPILRRKNERYDVDLKFEYKSNISKINIDACSDNFGDETTNIAALRLGQSLVEKFASDVFYFRHTLSSGVKIFNATDCPPSSNPILSDDADNRFTSWLWQVLWSHKFKLYKIQSIFRSSFQISQRPLLSAEQYSIGGAQSVRGFRENRHVRDNGRFFSVEARLPLRTAAVPKLDMQAILFSDYGSAWNDTYRERESIASVGIGYRWRYQNKFLAELFWAKQIQGGNDSLDDGLQDDGIHAKLNLELF